MTGFPDEVSTVSLSTGVDWIAAGTKVSAEVILRSRPAQIWERVSAGVAPGGLIGAVKAILFVGSTILQSIAQLIENKMKRRECLQVCGDVLVIHWRVGRLKDRKVFFCFSSDKARWLWSLGWRSWLTGSLCGRVVEGLLAETSMSESKIGELSICGNLQAVVIRYGGDYTACRLIHYNLKLLGSTRDQS